MNKPTYRLAERDCWCRSCGEKLNKNVDRGVFWYSSANRGMNIIICPPCVIMIRGLLDEY